MRKLFFKPVTGTRVTLIFSGGLIALGLVFTALMVTGQPAKSAPTVSVPKATAAPATAATSADNRIVLVSGRDDHGLLETPHIPLYPTPGSNAALALLHDGDFARVLEIRGNWLRIQALTPAQETGWIDDYYLRGKALRTDGGGQVEFAAARLVNEQVYIAVYPLGQKTEVITWLPNTALREVGVR
jgi:hypothetical protein